MGIGFKTWRMPCVYLLALLAFSAVVVGLFCRLRLGLEWQVGLIISANSLYLLFFAYSLVQYLRGRVTVKFIVTMVVSLSIATLLISRFACPDYYVHDGRCTCAECQKLYNWE